MIASIGSLLKGMLCGAGLMYFLDPDRGRRRRSGAMDRALHLTREAEQLWEKGCRDLSNRSRGLAAETRRAISAAAVDDHQLIARVRAALGHYICDARQVEVSSSKGTVTLRGTVRPGEPEILIPAIEKIAGVLGVESALTTAGDPPPPRPINDSLTPGARMLLTSGGGLLMLNCLVRRGFTPSFLGVAGFGMLLRGLSDRPGGLLGLHGDRRKGLHTSIRIEAPVEKVFEFISDVEQSGRFLPDVVQVEPLGSGRIRWSVDGPAGIGRFTCEEVVLESIENEKIVWGSANDAPVRYLGEAYFVPEGEATRLDVRLSYEPPGGLVTHAAASLVGLDPRTQLRRSLSRIKNHLEAGTVPRGTTFDTLREHRG